MVKYKNIRVKKRGGGTRLQRVKVLASGKYKFVKNLTKSKSRTKSKSKTKTRKTRKSNPKGGKSMGKGKSLQKTAFKLIRIGALVAPAVAEATSSKATPDKFADAFEAYTGFNYRYPEKGFQWSSLIRGYGPFLGACLATYGIPKVVGIIRRL